VFKGELPRYLFNLILTGQLRNHVSCLFQLLQNRHWRRLGKLGHLATLQKFCDSVAMQPSYRCHDIGS
jgi:hypothetical protein